MQSVLSLIQFWLYHPALLHGIAFLLGLFCHFESSFWLILPLLCLWLPFLLATLHPLHREIAKPLVLSAFTFLTAWSTASTFYTFPELPAQGISGKTQLKIYAISLQPSFFGNRWIYRSELQHFFPDNSVHSIAVSLPCLISFPERPGQARPLANQEYEVSGKLMQTDKGHYLLKVSSKTIWRAIPHTWSWAEIRYQWKKKARRWIEAQFSSPLSGSFLAGLATGEFDEYWMRQQFARFGLQHLLAISGFHFAILAGLLSFLLRLFLTLRTRLICLLICLSLYSFFLGAQASILRAWIMCSLTLIGGLIDKPTTALNSLGFALLVTMGYHPPLCQELGFQLSFTTTLAILLFYPPAIKWLMELFPKRRLSTVILMNHMNQYGYCLLVFLRQGCALTLAVNIVALPLTLYYFQQFPLMSLLYNLFFPFLVSGSLCLFLLGCIFTFIPFLADIFHHLNDAYTFFLLQLIYQVPSEIDSYWTVQSLSTGWLILYLCLALLLGILWKQRSSSAIQKEIFSFI